MKRKRKVPAASPERAAVKQSVAAHFKAQLRKPVMPPMAAEFILRNPTPYADITVMRSGKKLTVKHVAVLDGKLSIEVLS